MITRTETTLKFLKDADKMRQQFSKDDPGWAAQLRERAATRFLEEGFPTTKDEEWKYTNLSPIRERIFHFPTDRDVVADQDMLRVHLSDEDINIVFVNGRLSKELSSLDKLPQGIRAGNLADGLAEDDPQLKERLLRHAEEHGDVFTALNTAFHKDGAYITIDKNAVSKTLVHIVHVTAGKEQSAALFPRTMIIAGPSSETQILESHIGFCASEYFVCALSDIFLSENAKLVYCKAQDEGLNAFHVGATRVWQERDSQLESFSQATGGRLVRNNLTVTLTGEGAHATINGLYANRGHQHVDNHTAVHHIPPNCTSSQLYKGILTENAHAVFNGKIFVRREAQQTNSYQLNKNLLLSKHCGVDTKPQLEIAADDVKCTHGATIGQLNEDELFYLRTRAIPKATAVKMLARGFVDDILDRIGNESIHRKLEHHLVKFFDVL